jgi:hypothetical protein
MWALCVHAMHTREELDVATVRFEGFKDPSVLEFGSFRSRSPLVHDHAIGNVDYTKPAYGIRSRKPQWSKRWNHSVE